MIEGSDAIRLWPGQSVRRRESLMQAAIVCQDGLAAAILFIIHTDVEPVVYSMADHVRGTVREMARCTTHNTQAGKHIGA